MNHKHGYAGAEEHPLTKTHRVWRGMMNRCYNPEAQAYCNYGARGITVCKRWRASFEAFLGDMGASPEGMSLDRVDNDKGYSKKNCRWASVAEQNRNKRNTRNIEHAGECLCLSEWAARAGISKELLWYRLKQGWGMHFAISIPPRKVSNGT
jgi:hypothetical protein